MKKTILSFTLLTLGLNAFSQYRDTLKVDSLQEIIIQAERKSLDISSSIASKLNIRNIENPQVLNTVNQLVIQQQGITDFPTVLRNIPGLTRSWASVSPFYTSRGFMVRNYIRNGMVSYAASDIDPVNLEQVDVVKGPVGTLFGSALVSYAGMINRVTKKPDQNRRIIAGYQFGSYGLSRLTMDINSPLNASKTALFRLNASHTNDGSFQDAGFLKSTFIAPSLEYRVNERMTVSLDAEIYEREGTSQPQFSPMGPKQPKSTTTWASTTEDLQIDYKQSFSNNSIRLKNPARNFYGKIDYQFSDNWAMQTNFVTGLTSNTGNYLTFSISPGDSLIFRSVSNYPTSKINTLQFQQNFTGDFNIGTIRNRLLAGIDYYRINNHSESNALGGRGGRPVFDQLRIHGQNDNYNSINPELIQNKLLGLSSLSTETAQQTLGFYVSDVINPIDRLSILLSARFDRFFNDGVRNKTSNLITGKYIQNSFSPKLGVVYEVIDKQLSVFANYNNGFQNIGPVTQPDGSISVFKPEYANQKEFGIKSDLFNNKLTATVSYYDIRVKNSLRPDDDRPTFTIQEGDRFSKGVEVDLVSSPVKGLFLKAGYAYNNSEFTQAAAAVKGKRPVNSGPENAINWYASYSLVRSKISGLGFGFGGNYYDKNLLINNETSGTFYIPSYTLLNGNIFLDKPNYRFSVNVENLTNQKHYFGGFGTFTPGMLRRVSASILFKI